MMAMKFPIKSYAEFERFVFVVVLQFGILYFIRGEIVRVHGNSQLNVYLYDRQSIVILNFPAERRNVAFIGG